MESFLETLHRRGFSDHSAVAAYGRSPVSSSGFSCWRCPRWVPTPHPSSRRTPTTPPPTTTDLSEYPRLKKLEAELSKDNSAEEFDLALESLLDRLEREIAA